MKSTCAGRLAAAVLLCATGVSTAVGQTAGGGQASDYNFIVKTGAGYSDNVERVGSNGTSSLLGIVGVELVANRDSGRLQLASGIDLSMYHYFDAVRDADQFVGGGNLNARYEIREDRFFWVVDDTLTQVRENFRLPTSPDNRQNYNTFTTGPDLRWRFSPTMDATAELRYSRRDAGRDSTLNSQSYLARGLLTRAFSPQSRLSLAVATEKFNVEPSPLVQQADFDRREYYLRWLSVTSRTNFFVEAGLSQIDGNTNNESGPLLRANVSRQVSPSLTVTLSGARQFAVTGDQGQRFRINDTIDLADDLILPAAEPFEQTTARIDANYRRPRTELTLSYGRSKEDYKFATQLKRDTSDLRAAFLRRLTPRSQVQIFAGQTTDSINGQSYDVTEKYVGAAVLWRLTQSLSIASSVDRRNR
ncbi:MAG: hypothetical protein KDI32_08370, partial [Pseudomonadales bacterium]|nr:hypothetical protein [Pseudomonadales bacterium]